MENDFYLRLEERFRGSAEEIKQRLEAYLPMTAQVQALYPQSLAIDVGCGRGEWLELMAEQGFEVLGIDTNAAMVEQCRQKSLTAECDDALERLAAMDEQSAAVVSGFHIAEHLPFDVLMSLMHHAHRVLRPGGLLILETPNPENLNVGLWTFYMDPTHRHPLPPLLMQFLGEEAGFADNRILKLNGPARPEDGQPPLAGLAWSLSAHPDYALVAQKQRLPEQQALLDQLLHTDLEQPLQQVNQELERVQHEWNALHQKLKTCEAEHAEEAAEWQQRLVDSKEAIKKAEQDAETTHEHYMNMRHQLRDIQAAHHELQQRAEGVYQQMMAMHQSTSWRMTAPLRRLAHLRRSAPAKLRQRLRGLLRRLYRLAAATPGVGRAGRHLLHRVPVLQRFKQRLYTAPHTPQQSHVQPAGSRRQQRIAQDIAQRLGEQDSQGGH